MRIEGTYTFLAPIEHVYLALTAPETVPHVLEGCERILQMGPATTDGTLAYEVRLRSAVDATNVTILHLRATPLRAPEHLRLAARIHTRAQVVTAEGTLDLVPQEDATIVAYAFEVMPQRGEADTPGGASDAVERARLTARARAVCGTLAAYLRRAGDELPTLPPGVGMVTPRGEIRVVPVKTPEPLVRAARPAMVRASWMAAGVVTGLGMIVLTLGLLRRMAGQHD